MRAWRFGPVLFGLLLTASRAFGGTTIEFHIPAGTGEGPWNTQDQMLMVHVGDTVHLVNDDSIHHELHTEGAPCVHGQNMAPNGGTDDCVIIAPFDPSDTGPVFDHYVGPTAPFWIEASN